MHIMGRPYTSVKTEPQNVNGLPICENWTPRNFPAVWCVHEYVSKKEAELFILQPHTTATV